MMYFWDKCAYKCIYVAYAQQMSKSKYMSSWLLDAFLKSYAILGLC